MAVSEPERREFYEAMEGLIGEKKANTLMSLLPPTGWGDVATRQDLEAHAALTRLALEAHSVATKKDLELLESRLREQILRTALMVNIPSILAAVGLSFAATRLG